MGIEGARSGMAILLSVAGLRGPQKVAPLVGKSFTFTAVNILDKADYA